MSKMVNKVLSETWPKAEDELFISCKHDSEFFDW